MNTCMDERPLAWNLNDLKSNNTKKRSTPPRSCHGHRKVASLVGSVTALLRHSVCLTFLFYLSTYLFELFIFYCIIEKRLYRHTFRVAFEQ